jgi:hypothetical protein
MLPLTNGPCLPRRDPAGDEGEERRRQEESEKGDEGEFLLTYCWRHDFLPARAGFCAQGIWTNVYPILQWLVGVSIRTPRCGESIMVGDTGSLLQFGR